MCLQMLSLPQGSQCDTRRLVRTVRLRTGFVSSLSPRPRQAPAVSRSVQVPEQWTPMQGMGYPRSGPPNVGVRRADLVCRK